MTTERAMIGLSPHRRCAGLSRDEKQDTRKECDFEQCGHDGDCLIYFAQRQAHAPLEASGEDALGEKVQIRMHRRKHRRFQWLHDAICSLLGYLRKRIEYLE